MSEYPEHDVKLMEVPVEHITIGERFRVEYGNIEALKKSIEKNGLIQPLAVELTSEGFNLLAGGRRLRAIKEMNWDKVPVRVYPNELSKVRRLAIELSENLDREDMTWAEQAKLQRTIHNLYTEEYGEAVRTGKAGKDDTTWSQGKTAELLGKSQGQVSKAIKVAEALEAVPELGDRCKSVNDAFTLLNNMGSNMEHLKSLREADQRRSQLNVDVRKKELLDSYIIGEYLEKSNNAPMNSVDLVEIDPPYGIELDRLRKGGSTGKLTSGLDGEYVEINADHYYERMVKYFDRAYSLLKRDGWLIVWFAPEPWFEPVHLAIQEAGFKTRRMPNIWYKGEGYGQTMQPKMYLPNSYEMFFVARKGSPEIQRQGRSNVFQFRPVPPSNKRHPAERPIELMQEILSTYVDRGSRVCVPFLGSGVTLLAADNLNIDGWGYDLSEEYKAKYNDRLQTGGKPGLWLGFGR